MAHILTPAGWHPCPQFSREIAVAWRVVERLEAAGLWAQLSTAFLIGDERSAGFTPHGTTGWNGRPDYRAVAPTMPLAICRAALVWAAEREER